jgi:hypothetical protein
LHTYKLQKASLTRAVARAMKTRATARAERKKTQPDSTHRGIFFNGAGDGSNQRVRGPTRDVAPSSSQIKNLTARKCQKYLEDRIAAELLTFDVQSPRFK